MTDTEIAQDYLDCVHGDHGEWWKRRADEFIEDFMDVDSQMAWRNWAQIREGEVAPA